MPFPSIHDTPARLAEKVRGYGGSLYFEDTVVTSWDTNTKTPQEVHEDGRSYLNCVSEYLTGETCEGNAKNDMGECRMVSSWLFGRFVVPDFHCRSRTVPQHELMQVHGIFACATTY